MGELEQLLLLFVAAIILAAAGRRVGAPYPVFLALGERLLHALDLHDDDPVGREVRAARDRALRAGLASIEAEQSAIADAVRHELMAHLASETTSPAGHARRADHNDFHRDALDAARQAVLAMRASNEIGDDASHQLEEQLDWLEMIGDRKTE